MSAREKAGGGSSDVQNPIEISKILKESIILMEFIITQLNQMCDFNLKHFDENVKTLLTFETLNKEINKWMIDAEASFKTPNITISKTKNIQSQIQSGSDNAIGEFDKLIVAHDSNISAVEHANINLFYIQACTGERLNEDQPRLDIENSKIIDILRESGNSKNYTTFSELANLLNKKMMTAKMPKFSYNQLKNVSMIYDSSIDENNHSYISHFINELQSKNNLYWWQIMSYPYDHDDETNIIDVLKGILEPIIKGKSKNTEIFTENVFTVEKYNAFFNKLKNTKYLAPDDSSLTVNFTRNRDINLQHIGVLYPYFGTMFNIRKARLTEEYNYMNGIIHIPLLNRIRPRIDIEKAEIMHFMQSSHNIAKAIKEEENDKNKFFSYFFRKSVPETLFLWRGSRDYNEFVPGELQRMIAKLHNWSIDIENSFDKLKKNGDIALWKTQSNNGIFVYIENENEPEKMNVDKTFFSNDSELKRQLFLKLQDHIRRAEFALQKKHEVDTAELSQFQQSLKTGDWSYFVKSAKDAGSTLYTGLKQGVAGFKNFLGDAWNFIAPPLEEQIEMIQEQIVINGGGYTNEKNHELYKIIIQIIEELKIKEIKKGGEYNKIKTKEYDDAIGEITRNLSKHSIAPTSFTTNQQPPAFDPQSFTTNDQTPAFAPIQQTPHPQKKNVRHAGGDLGPIGENKLIANPYFPRQNVANIQSGLYNPHLYPTSGNPTGGEYRANSNMPLGFPHAYNNMQVATPSGGSRNQHSAVGGIGMPTGRFASVNFARYNTPFLPLTAANLPTGGGSRAMTPAQQRAAAPSDMQSLGGDDMNGGSKTRKPRHSMSKNKKTLRRNPRKLMSRRQKYSRRK